MSPSRTKQVSTVALVTRIVVARVVVPMRVGSGQSMELGTGGLLF